MINETSLDALREKISVILSEKRFAHTLGVERAVRELGAHFLPDSVLELAAAALLHDVAKELTKDEQVAIMRRGGMAFTDEDYASKPLYHAFAAPTVIRERFPEFATENVLSAVLFHTSADADMSLFDEIIFIADFIEEGRKYDACREARKELLSALEDEANIEKKLRILHFAVLRVIDFTVKYLENEGKTVNSRMILARKSIASKLI